MLQTLEYPVQVGCECATAKQRVTCATTETTRGAGALALKQRVETCIRYNALLLCEVVCDNSASEKIFPALCAPAGPPGKLKGALRPAS